MMACHGCFGLTVAKSMYKHNKAAQKMVPFYLTGWYIVLRLTILQWVGLWSLLCSKHNQFLECCPVKQWKQFWRKSAEQIKRFHRNWNNGAYMMHCSLCIFDHFHISHTVAWMTPPFHNMIILADIAKCFDLAGKVTFTQILWVMGSFPDLTTR